MANYQNRTEFYDLMRQKAVDILSLDIPESEREKSLSLLKETIIRYEGMSDDVERREKALKELDKGLVNFLGICRKIDSCAKRLRESITSVERITFDYGVSLNREKN